MPNDSFYSFLTILPVEKNQDLIAPDDHPFKSLLTSIISGICSLKYANILTLWLMTYIKEASPPYL